VWKLEKTEYTEYLYVIKRKSHLLLKIVQ